MPRGLIGLLTKTAKKIVTYFCNPRGTFLAKKGGYMWELVGVFGSNDPRKWLMFLHKNRYFPTRKPKLIWTKIDQNWPKYAMRIMQILRTGTCRRARGLIFSLFYQNQNFMGVCRRNHQDPTNRCRVIC